MTPADGKHRLGPYRDPQVGAAVLTSTRRLLLERGYRGTSIDAIAEDAGVSRPTIYRRWPSKAHVIYDAVFPPEAPPVDVSAEPVSEITRIIRGILAFMGDPAARAAMPGLMSDMRSDPALRASLVERHSVSVAAGLQELITKNSGSVRQVDGDTVLDVIVGAAMQALCFREIDELDGYVASLVDLLLHGFSTRCECSHGGQRAPATRP